MSKDTARQSAGAAVLAINGGSSSIKFAIYRAGNSLELTHWGGIDRIGLSAATFSVFEGSGQRLVDQQVEAPDYDAAIGVLLDWLTDQAMLASLSAVGHRIVHGMQYSAPQRVTPDLLARLRQIIPIDPEHLPGEIALVEAFGKRRADLPQVACFDTAFHRTMPRVASLLPIPRRYADEGVERYGFHGLSYAYLLEELERVAGAAAARGRVILAHLGNGASLAAAHEGRCIDTSMGFTPTGGIPMSTRSGDLDPGVAWYLMNRDRMSPEEFNKLINRQSGLLGISQTSSDMRELLKREPSDVRAAEAVGVFCYQIRKWIGAFAAALGGLDTLVFSGGIGENAGAVRARACQQLEFLGVAIDHERNAANDPVISSDDSRVDVRVIRTDEQRMIAKTVCRLLRLDEGGQCQ